MKKKNILLHLLGAVMMLILALVMISGCSKRDINEPANGNNTATTSVGDENKGADPDIIKKIKSDPESILTGIETLKKDYAELMNEAELDETEYLILISFTRAYLDEGKTEEAGKILARLKEIDEKNPDYLVLHAKYYFLTDNYSESEKLLEEALKNSPKSVPEILYYLSKVQFAAGKNDEAKATTKEIVEKYPSSLYTALVK